jgi:hypothetical protein
MNSRRLNWSNCIRCHEAKGEWEDTELALVSQPGSPVISAVHSGSDVTSGGRRFAFVQILLQKSFCTRDQISFGYTRDFRVKMWGTSSPEDKLAGDLGNVIEAISIDGRGSDCLTAGKLAPGNFGLLQQYRHKASH